SWPSRTDRPGAGALQTAAQPPGADQPLLALEGAHMRNPWWWRLQAGEQEVAGDSGQHRVHRIAVGGTGMPGVHGRPGPGASAASKASANHSWPSTRVSALHRKAGAGT